MGRNPEYFHSEEILKIFNEELLTIVSKKKFSIFPMGRNPRYFQWEEILNIFNRKRGATHPKHTSDANFASPRHFSLHSHELLVFILAELRPTTPSSEKNARFFYIPLL